MFSNPSQIVSELGLTAGMTVADFGAGSGFYTLAVGKILAGSGKVYAIDIRRDIIQKLSNLASAAHLNNVEVIWGDVEKVGGTKLADGAVDFVVASNLLFQLDRKEDFLAEVKRVLKSNGRALVVDWRDSFDNMGPEAARVVSPEAARALFEKAGFFFEREINAGSHHYGFIFKKI